MRHQLFNIYGPISIHSYGLAIVIGLLVFTFLIKRNKNFQKLGLESIFSEAVLISILAALVGGRLVFMLSHPNEIKSISDFCAIWQAGYSILGSILGVLITLPLYLWYKKKPIFKFLDITAIYVPILQSISRLGCLCAGCCYGEPTQVPWGVIYTDPESVAPLFKCVHPTQLYSSGLLFIIFLLMFFFFQHNLHKKGQLSCMYLMLVSTERFVVDFWRGDRVFNTLIPYLSIHQLISLGIFICAFSTFVWITFLSRLAHEHI